MKMYINRFYRHLGKTVKSPVTHWSVLTVRIGKVTASFNLN
jgi:hypothetical protein